MYKTQQHLNDIYRNCNEIVDYLANINETKKADKIMQFTLQIEECLVNIRTLVENLGLSIMQKSDQVHILKDHVQQLEFDFDMVD